ncbi:holo-ACP synthase [Calidifontibacter terrae]
MSVVGVGVDLVVVSRFTATIQRTPGLAARLFQVEELQGAPSTIAGRFAAKEAIAKALGAPAGLAWTDAVVRRTTAGQPFFQVAGTVAGRARELGVDRFHLSISHDGDFVTAMVVAEGDGPPQVPSPYDDPS